MEITKELLKQKFEEYNKLYFNNELPMCTFSYNYPKSEIICTQIKRLA